MVYRKIITALISFVLAILCVFSVSAADSICSAVFIGGAEGFVFSPDSSDLFTKCKGMMPGDTVNQEIIVKNGQTKDAAIYLRLEVDERYKSFLDNITIVVAQEGKTLASCKASTPGELATNKLIDVYKPGESSSLNFKISMDINMGNEYKNAQGVIELIFSVELGEEGTTVYNPAGVQTDPNYPNGTTAVSPDGKKPDYYTTEPKTDQYGHLLPDPDNPYTGRDMKKVRIALCIAIASLGVILLLAANKRKQTESDLPEYGEEIKDIAVTKHDDNESDNSVQ